MKKLGLLVRADNTGLGYQTRSYYKHLNPDKVMLVDIKNYNGNEQHYDWYPDAQISKGFPNFQDCINFLSGLDVVLTAETAYNNEFYKYARDMGVKTICVENPEFYDFIKYPDLAMPDVIILPSTWKETEIRVHAEAKGVKVYQVHHPIDRDEFPFKLRTTKKIIHIAGKPAAQDRNGTWDYLRACPEGVVTTQSEDLAKVIRARYRNSRVITGLETAQEIYNNGDILVLPRKYGGNCLPLNEALSSGMPVIMPDIEPNNSILPKEWLVPANITSSFEPRTKVDIYSVHPRALAEKIEWFKTCDIEAESRKANEIADTISWEALRQRYLEIINE